MTNAGTETDLEKQFCVVFRKLFYLLYVVSLLNLLAFSAKIIRATYV